MQRKYIFRLDKAFYFPTWPVFDKKYRKATNLTFLISQAICSVPDRRLTLSQIYDWMVAAVPYFSERADSTSSGGWKVGLG